MIQRRRLRLGVVGISGWLALLALSLPGVPAAAEAPQRGGSVVFVIGSDPATANPILTTSSDVGLIGCIVYQGLTTIGPDGVPKPLLAKSWTISEDGKTYSFALNTARWHDGKPFTSEDVKYSLLQASAKYNAVFAAAGRMIEGIEAPSPDRVVVTLKQPFGPFLLSLSCTHGGAILPKHLFEGTDIATNPATTTKPVGTGAFKIETWVRGDHVRFVRNPDYYEAGKPYLDELIGKIIVQPSARAQALLSGEVDMVTYFYLPVADYPAIRANPTFKLSPAPTAPSQDMMFLNLRHKPLDDRRVRHALLMATDRNFLIRSAFQNVGRPGTAPFNKAGGWWAAPEIDYEKMYPFDVARANKALDDAGYRKGADGVRFRVRFTYNTDDAEAASLAVALQSMWRQVGVEVPLDPSERTTAAKRVFQDFDFDMYLTGYTSYFDPAMGLARTWISSSIGKPYGNPTGYSNPEIDALFEKAATRTSQEERGAIYRQIQVTLADELTVFNMRDREALDAIFHKVHGLESESHLATWRDAWIEK